jgi:hypothetical protein
VGDVPAPVMNRRILLGTVLPRQGLDADSAIQMLFVAVLFPHVADLTFIESCRLHARGNELWKAVEKRANPSDPYQRVETSSTGRRRRRRKPGKVSAARCHKSSTSTVPAPHTRGSGRAGADHRTGEKWLIRSTPSGVSLATTAHFGRYGEGVTAATRDREFSGTALHAHTARTVGPGRLSDRGTPASRQAAENGLAWRKPLPESWVTWRIGLGNLDFRHRFPKLSPPLTLVPNPSWSRGAARPPGVTGRTQPRSGGGRFAHARRASPGFPALPREWLPRGRLCHRMPPPVRAAPCPR